MCALYWLWISKLIWFMQSICNLITYFPCKSMVMVVLQYTVFKWYFYKLIHIRCWDKLNKWTHLYTAIY